LIAKGTTLPYNRNKHHRRSIRLPGYDYTSPGAYFVTICVRGGECLLGEVVDGEMRLNEWGQVAHDFWTQVPVHFPNVSIDAFVIMPNHLHAIIMIHERSNVAGYVEKGEETVPLHSNHGRRGAVAAPSSASQTPAPSWLGKPTLGQIVAYYKYQTTKRINQLRDMPGTRFWQRNYWEHIVRHEESLNRIREYIQNNPARWAEDQLHPTAPPNPFNQWQP